ncbi:MAG: transposase-like protein [Gammaproteobacteria bacterium]|jgi:transposase-like protein
MTKKKRTFTPEYKAEVVGLVRDGEKSSSAVARDRGLSESALRR